MPNQSSYRMNVKSADSQSDQVTHFNKPDWKKQDAYWRETFPKTEYGKKADYNTYEPAYRYGVMSYEKNRGKPYDELDKEELQGGWDNLKDYVTLKWDEAEEAVKDAYQRLFDDDDRQPRDYGYQVPHE